MGILFFSNHRQHEKMKLALLAGAVAADSWRGRCQDNGDGTWSQASMCGEQFIGFGSVVNQTCTVNDGATGREFTFVGGGAFISSANTFFGVDGLTTGADVVVFGNHADSCNEQWWNSSNADYFNGSVNSHVVNPDANSYNIQFWGPNESMVEAIQYYINETVGSVDMADAENGAEPFTYTLNHQQYNNKQFTLNLKNHAGTALSVANISCIHGSNPTHGCDIVQDPNDADQYLITTKEINAQLLGFQVSVNGDEVPDLWASSVTGASL